MKRRVQKKSRNPTPEQLIKLFSVVAVARLAAVDIRGNGCMRLPQPIFEALCGRLLDRQIPVFDTVTWLKRAAADAPSRSAVYRFSVHLFREYSAAATLTRIS